jgi:hypothetical protein
MGKIFYSGLSFILLICLNTVHVRSQIAVSGTLQDAEDNSSLSYANVALLHEPDSVFVTGTTSDEKGWFLLQVPDSGSYLLRLSYLGYGTQFIPVQLFQQEKTKSLGVIGIPKSGENLQEVVIVGKKPMYSYEGEKKIYNVSEDPSVQGGVANDALQNAPGVYVDMEGNITLRGVSGVEIWINDKPSKIKEEGLKSFLQQLPANSISRIEVITNPSARYGAEGTGGIINIITHDKITKNRLLSFGFNGSTQFSYSPWLSLVLSNEKISFTSYLSHSSFENNNTSHSSGYVLNEGDTIYSTESNSGGGWNYGWTYGHIGFTWEIDTMTTFDIWGGGSVSRNESKYNTSTIRIMDDGEIFQYLRNSWGTGEGTYVNGGLSLDRRFKKEGHHLILESYLGNHINENQRDYEKLFSVQTWDNQKYRQISSGNGLWGQAELNYTNPLGKNKELESGTTLEISNQYSDTPTDTFDFVSNQYYYADIYSNVSDQRILSGAAYVTYKDTIKFLTYKAGLRYEYCNLSMESVALPEALHRSFGTFFPTLHLSTKTKNNHNFTLSYARRVRNPMWGLDPFVNRIDNENIYAGNPWLNPTYTDSYEAGYAKFFQSGASISATAFHRRTLNDITQRTDGVFDTILGRYTIYTTFVNAGKTIFNGADFTVSFNPVKNLRMVWYTNAYHQNFYADFDTYVIDKSDFTFNSRLMFMYNISLFRIQLMGNYRSASQNLTGSEDPTYWMNLTVNADLFNNKLSLRLGMMDVFNWMERNVSTTTPSYISTSSSKQKSQYLTFGITFRFGKIELERMQRQPDNSVPMN